GPTGRRRVVGFEPPRAGPPRAGRRTFVTRDGRSEFAAPRRVSGGSARTAGPSGAPRRARRLTDTGRRRRPDATSRRDGDADAGAGAAAGVDPSAEAMAGLCRVSTQVAKTPIQLNI